MLRWNTCESLSITASGKPAGKWAVFSETLPPPVANAMIHGTDTMHDLESACMMAVHGMVRVVLSRARRMTVYFIVDRGRCRW